MAITLDIDSRRFSQAITKFVRVMEMESGKALKRVAKGVVLRAAKYTPPFDPPLVSGVVRKQSWSKQRKAGTQAVESDIKALFVPMQNSPLDLEKGEVLTFEDWVLRKSSFFNKPENANAKRSVLKYIRAGDWTNLTTVLTRCKQRIASVVKQATPALHKQSRGAWGRVLESRKKHPFFVEDVRSINRLLKAKKQNVGMAKAGWAKAAKGVGLKLPNWVLKHMQPGIYRELRMKAQVTGWPEIIVGNSVPWMQKTGSQLRIMKLAVRDSITSMHLEMKAVLKKNAARWNGGMH